MCRMPPCLGSAACALLNAAKARAAAAKAVSFAVIDVSPMCRAVGSLAAAAYRCLPVTLAGVFCPINRWPQRSNDFPASLAIDRRLAPPCRIECDGLEPGSVTGESDHIVAETAARIFADLADPQTINRAKDGTKDGAKDGLGKRRCGGRSPRPGCRSPGFRRIWAARARALPTAFAVLANRRPLRARRAARRNADRRLAAGARRLAGAGRRHDRRPCPAARPHHARQRRHAQRPRARRSLRGGCAAHRRAGRRHRRAGGDQRLPDR